MSARVKNLEYYLQGIKEGNRIILGQAFTLIESKNATQRAMAEEILSKLEFSKNASIRIGISGSPGVGKSTFIENLGKHILKDNVKIAVLAVDPTSVISKGSILGDKTRMAELSIHPNVFIRPSPNAETLGGVTSTTYESILLCEAAGYDIIFVETVGVGQAEVMVHNLVDCFVLLLLPGAGDDLQGIKRGIAELADLIVVHKADGDRLKLAKEIQRAYSNAIHFFAPKEHNIITQVVQASSLDQTGVDEIWEIISEFNEQIHSTDFKSQRRKQQKLSIFQDLLNQKILATFKSQNKDLIESMY
ncbi:MAG: methylmalonyl Co-A mutase-associated GTPase MeaB, partial [Bacteroidota bacterium]